MFTNEQIQRARELIKDVQNAHSAEEQDRILRDNVSLEEYYCVEVVLEMDRRARMAEEKLSSLRNKISQAIPSVPRDKLRELKDEMHHRNSYKS